MRFRELALYLEKLEKTASRIEITKILAELFKETNKEEIDKVVYLLLGTLAPSYRGIVFNLAERMMLQVISKAYRIDLEEVRSLYKEKGDLGDLSYNLSKNLKLRIQNLKVNDVYTKLVEVANDEGEGSQDRKIDKMAKLLSTLDPLSSKFVSRIPVGKLRLGFSDKTILDALSWMEEGNKSKKVKLEKAYQVTPDVGVIARNVKNLGINKAVSGVKPVIGTPVLPMLAQRLKSPSEMIEKMHKVFVEPKFDGLRVLIHFKRDKKGDFIKAFTRNLNDVYEMFTELKGIGKYLKAYDVILDSEAVGMDPEMIRLADFQTTMRRRRKYEIDKKAKEIPLRFQVFDIIYKDGVNLMEIPYYERREILKSVVISNNLLVVDEALVTEDPEVINKEYRKRINEGLEGIIIKKYDTNYIPGRTGWRWVKMKEEEKAIGKLADTVDCIVMGSYSGKGKRAQFGMGGFLVGIMDKDKVMTITKIGTGLTDEQFREMYERLKKLEVKEKPKEYGEVNKLLVPDFWVEASLVVEIAADEITKSPIHSSNFALRFPRLIRFRDDKGFRDATNIREIEKLYKLQKTKG